MGLCPESLHAWQRVVKEVGGALNGVDLNLAGGCDAAHHRPCMVNAGLSPNIKEQPRQRQTTQRGRPRLGHAARQA